MKLRREDRGNFEMEVESGDFSSSEINVIMGQNGTGKTTFIKLLAGLEQPMDGLKLPKLNVS